jgi:hypothetical protein
MTLPTPTGSAEWLTRCALSADALAKPAGPYAHRYSGFRLSRFNGVEGLVLGTRFRGRHVAPGVRPRLAASVKT